MKNFSAFLASGLLLIASFPGGYGCEVWQRERNNGSCKNCPYGQVQSTTNKKSCVPCPDGQVRGKKRDGSGLGKCASAVGICDAHEWAVDGKCESCDDGKISVDKVNCVSCDRGLVRGNADGSADGGCVDADTICKPNQRARRGRCRTCSGNEISPRPATSRCKICASGTVPRTDYSKCYFDVNSQSSFKAPNLINSTTTETVSTVTVSVRMMVTKNPSQFTYVVAKGYIGKCSHASYALYFSDGLKFYVGDSSKFYATPAAKINTNQWYHVVGTFDGTNAKLYVDGKLIGSTAAKMMDDKKLLTIGYYGDPECKPALPTLSDATLSELCLFSKALSDKDVTQLYNQCR